MRDWTRPRGSENTRASAVTSAPEDSGQRLGRYELEEIVGSGAMGVVYRARDVDLGRTVAIKTIREELLSQERIYQTYRTRFYREASIFGSLSHPNIVTLYDIGEGDEGIPFLTMEYVEGASLAEHADQGKKFSFDQLMWLFAQLASAIDYAHGQDVIHRDIKPSNILVTPEGEVKVADFGVAKLLGTEFTRSQTRFGTPGYMSPEQVVGKTLTQRADIFSLGVVAFELLSGELPFPGTHVHTILHKLVHVDPVLPANLDPEILDPESWQDIFGRALAKEPGERYPTAAAFVSELVELLPGSWLGELTTLTKDETPDFSPVQPARAARQNTLTLWSSGKANDTSEIELEFLFDDEESAADHSGA